VPIAVAESEANELLYCDPSPNKETIQSLPTMKYFQQGSRISVKRIRLR